MDKIDGVNVPEMRGREVFLKTLTVSQADPEKNWVASYRFDVCLASTGERIGHISLRPSSDEIAVYYNGNIGYSIEPDYRGHRYAEKACRLLPPLLRLHGLDRVSFTCMPENTASRRTIERLGARYIETVDVPPDNPSYDTPGQRACRFEWLVPAEG